MRPVREIDPEFFASDEPIVEHLPLLDRWLAAMGGGQPLAGVTGLLVQHQLSNQVPMLKALQTLGLDPARTWWLDIPYTSRADIRTYAHEHLHVPLDQLWESRFPVLEAYAPYQHRRAVDVLLAASEQSPGPLLVLDDGAYILEALATLAPGRRPTRVAIVEQTTRGFIKFERNATLRAVASTLPLVDVARSVPKRTLEPPFIAMAVCAALQGHLERFFPDGLGGQCLVIGYGAIGEQVVSFVRHSLELDRDAVHVYDVDPARAQVARRRGYPAWDRSDLGCRFRLVLGCSGQAAFTVGDAAFLEDGAVLVSASSGAVELSRQEFIELADASDRDDMEIERDGVQLFDVHANVRIRLAGRVATFVNAGFPVNFNGRRTVCPTRFIQPTPTMMVAAATQAAEALVTSQSGVIDLDPRFCDWVDPAFRSLLGERASWLLPVPESAW